MTKKMKISPEGILEGFSSREFDFKSGKSDLSTPQVSDALKKLTGANGVIHGIKPLKEDFKIMGSAITVRTRSDDWGTCLKAIELAGKGDILFICSDEDDSAVWGELTSKSAQKKGLGGTVVYGAVRDLAGIKKLNYPVFARSIVPNAGYPLAEGEIGVPLKCGETSINSGDLVMADDCGVVVVPLEHLSEVMKEASTIKKREIKLIGRIEDGWSLSEVLDLKK